MSQEFNYQSGRSAKNVEVGPFLTGFQGKTYKASLQVADFKELFSSGCHVASRVVLYQSFQP